MPDDLAAARRALYRRGATDADRERYARLAARAPGERAGGAPQTRSRRPRAVSRVVAGLAVGVVALGLLSAVGSVVRPAIAPEPGTTVALDPSAGRQVLFSRSPAAPPATAALDLTRMPYGWSTPRVADLRRGGSAPVLLHAALRPASSQLLLAVACDGSSARFRATLLVHGDRFGRPVSGSCAQQALNGIDLPGGNGTAEVRVRISAARVFTAALLAE